MLLTFLLPVVIYVVTQTVGQDVEQEALDTHTNIKIEEKQEREIEDDTTPTPHSSENNSSRSSVVVDEGDSRVRINIDNQTGDSNSDAAPSFSLAEFHYPGANITQSTSSQITLTTPDTADAVTNWYEDKIRAKGMNVQSFVRTSTNGKVLNKLGAAGGGQEVLVEISAQSDGGMTTIIVKSE